MIRYFAIIVCFISNSLFSQESFNFVIDSVSVDFKINMEGEYINEEVKVSNLSESAIYVPNMSTKEYYFFVLGDKLHSYLGIMMSITGAPNLGGNIQLIKVEPKGVYTLNVKIKKGKPIECFSFGLDFITENNKHLIKSKNDELWIATTDYVDVKKYLYSKQD
jgi:hypothetical protein